MGTCGGEEEEGGRMIGETGKGKRRRRLDDSERGEGRKGNRGTDGRTDGRRKEGEEVRAAVLDG